MLLFFMALISRLCLVELQEQSVSQSSWFFGADLKLSILLLHEKKIQTLNQQHTQN